MVGNMFLKYINLHLQEIKLNSQPFINVIAIGNLFQLKPVYDDYIFKDLKKTMDHFVQIHGGNTFKSLNYQKSWDKNDRQF